MLIVGAILPWQAILVQLLRVYTPALRGNSSPTDNWLEIFTAPSILLICM